MTDNINTMFRSDFFMPTGQCLSIKRVFTK